MSGMSTDNAVILVPKEQPPAVHPEPGTEVAIPEQEDPALWLGPIPWVAYFLCTAELAERASYYATTGVISNFIEFPLPPGSSSGKAPGFNQHAGALGKGLQYASGVVNKRLHLRRLCRPHFGGWIADTRLGRYRTIIFGILVGFVGHAIMTGGAAPSVLKAGNGVAPFQIGYWILAIGAGIFKPNVAPTVLDQYTHQRPYVTTTKKGERVIVDPEMTIQRIMTIYYGFINIGAFYAIASTYAEKYVGFWLAFLYPPSSTSSCPSSSWGSELTAFFKVIWLALKKNKFNPWAKDFWGKLVSDIKRTLTACAIFLYIPLYHISLTAASGPWAPTKALP
ncbi:POT family-domain-containing protein [Mycena olivaceomarginata]|nr:POT family-domain-containing protein [Mycena olivaceomarginata]